MVNKQTAQRWLSLFILLHVIAWTLAPAWVRFTLPMDAMEGTTWGHQLEWGYDKNPFLNGWLTHLAVFLGGQSGWAIYLFSQLSVALCFWAVWRLGSKFLTPVYALASVMILEAMQYYNFHAIDFNDNTLELGLWALTSLFFYQAAKDKKLIDWLLTGFFAGLSMMAKYYTVVLLIPMLLFFIIHANTRKQFRAPQLYCGLLVFLIVIAPHAIWLFSHDFVTVTYAIGRVSAQPTWANHLHNPLQFAWQQAEVLFPALLLFSLLLMGKKPFLPRAEMSISTFDNSFLFFVGAGPLLVTLLLSAVTGIQLRAGWGQPLLSLSGIMLIAWIKPNITRDRFYQFLIAVFCLLIAMSISYCVALSRAKKPSSANFPGAMIAAALTEQWKKQYHTPLAYVAGPRWLAGNIAFYSKDHPAVYIDWDKKVSPWIDEKKLKQQGAIFVWDPTEARQVMPPEVQARFNKTGMLQIMRFSWLRNKTMAPVEISVAFLPPAQ